MDHGAFNWCAIVSPTYHTNSHLWEWAGIKPEDAYTDLAQAELAVQDVVEKVRRHKAEWDENRDEWDAYEASRRGKALTMKQRMLVERLHGQAPSRKVKLVRPCLILDDLSHSRLLQGSRYFINLVLRNRHVVHNPQVGLSILVICQSVKAGLPRVLRSNVNLWVIFGTRDRDIIKDVWSEVSGKISKSAFSKLFDFCTRKQHSYMVVDLTQRNPRHVFRKTLEGAFLEVEEESDAED